MFLLGEGLGQADSAGKHLFSFLLSSLSCPPKQPLFLSSSHVQEAEKSLLWYLTDLQNSADVGRLERNILTETGNSELCPCLLCGPRGHFLSLRASVSSSVKWNVISRVHSAMRINTGPLTYVDFLGNSGLEGIPLLPSIP